MPRAFYAGVYDPAMIPKVNDAVLSSPVVTGYAAAREPKAMAFHAWGRMFAASGAASDTAAQQAALADCNNDPDRKGQDGPCFLYAVGTRVVLPQRLTRPVGDPYNPIIAAGLRIRSSAYDPAYPGARGK